MGLRCTLDSSASDGRTWWAHFEFTRINIGLTILHKKIEELRIVDLKTVRSARPCGSSADVGF
jgi:hypothetical protein